MKINKKQLCTICNYTFFSLVIVACLVLTIVLKLNWITLLSCVAGILYVVLLSDRSVWNFIVGLVSSATYIYVAFEAKLYGEVIFYLAVDLPMIVVSFCMWKKHLDKTNRVAAKKLNWKQILLTIVACGAVMVGYAFLLKAIGGVNVFVDAASTVVSFVATLLMAFRYREQWFLWLVVNILSVVMWAITFDLLMLIMSASCLLSCFVGFINWTNSTKAEKKPLEE